MSETLHKLRKEHLERRARIAAAAVPDTAPQRVVKREMSYVTNKRRVPLAPATSPVAAPTAPMELPEVQPSSILFVSFVQRCVATYYGYPLDIVTGPSRASGISRARHVAMYVVETLTARSRTDIGARFKRDASSVFHATNKIRKQLEYDAELREEVDTLIAHVIETRKNREKRI